MKNFDSETVSNWAIAMIGETTATGELKEDIQRMDHLETLIEVTGCLIDAIGDAAMTADREEPGMKAIGQRAREALISFGKELNEGYGG